MSGVTVVIPAHRAERWLDDALRSVVGVPDVEAVIVIEDGVHDGTAGVVRKHPSVTHVVLDPGRGAQHARNEGLRRVRSEFVMFLDADDYVSDGLITGLVESLRRTGAGVGFGPQTRLYPDGRIETRMPPASDDPFEYALQWIGGDPGPNPSAIVWRTSTIREIGGWDTALTKNQDGELAVRALLMGVAMCRGFLGTGAYRIHREGSIRSTVERDALASHRHIIGKFSTLGAGLPREDRARLESALLSYVATRVKNSARDADWTTAKHWFGVLAASGAGGLPHGAPRWQRFLVQSQRWRVPAVAFGLLAAAYAGRRMLGR